MKKYLLNFLCLAVISSSASVATVPVSGSSASDGLANVQDDKKFGVPIQFGWFRQGVEFKDIEVTKKSINYVMVGYPFTRMFEWDNGYFGMFDASGIFLFTTSDDVDDIQKFNAFGKFGFGFGKNFTNEFNAGVKGGLIFGPAIDTNFLFGPFIAFFANYKLTKYIALGFDAAYNFSLNNKPKEFSAFKKINNGFSVGVNLTFYTK